MNHDNNVQLELNGDVAASEIIALRELEYGPQQSENIWKDCINRALAIASARDTDTNEIVGVAFLIGNARHAQVVDMLVHPQYRGNKLGGKLLDMCIRYAREHSILFVGLTYDHNHPWLKDFYADHGFREVNFAMWLDDSLKNLENR